MIYFHLKNRMLYLSPKLVIEMKKMSNEELTREMLEELKGIRAELPPKPAPPASEKPIGFFAGFIDFLESKGIVGLALAVIIGGALGKVVSSLVENILMPIISVVITGVEWQYLFFEIGIQKVQYGLFIGSLIDFIIISIVVYWLMKQVEKVGLK